MISIDGLNEKQIKMLDMIWSFQSLDELYGWQSTLPFREQIECEALIELIMLAMLDETVENDKEFPQTQSLLREIFQNNSENQ